MFLFFIFFLVLHSHELLKTFPVYEEVEGIQVLPNTEEFSRKIPGSDSGGGSSGSGNLVAVAGKNGVVRVFTLEGQVKAGSEGRGVGGGMVQRGKAGGRRLISLFQILRAHLKWIEMKKKTSTRYTVTFTFHVKNRQKLSRTSTTVGSRRPDLTRLLNRASHVVPVPHRSNGLA